LAEEGAGDGNLEESEGAGAGARVSGFGEDGKGAGAGNFAAGMSIIIPLSSVPSCCAVPKSLSLEEELFDGGNGDNDGNGGGDGDSSRPFPSLPVSSPGLDGASGVFELLSGARGGDEAPLVVLLSSSSSPPPPVEVSAGTIPGGGEFI
jgi:hypothetical protein